MQTYLTLFYLSFCIYLEYYMSTYLFSDSVIFYVATNPRGEWGESLGNGEQPEETTNA